MTYTTYIRPILEYVSPVLDPHTNHNTNKIEMVQLRCARCVTGNIDRTTSVTFLINPLNWLTFEEHLPTPPCCDVHHNSQPGGHPLAILSHKNFILHKGSRLLTVPFCRSHVYASSVFLALVKTGTNLPSIQLMHHPLTPLSGC